MVEALQNQRNVVSPSRNHHWKSITTFSGRNWIDYGAVEPSLIRAFDRLARKTQPSMMELEERVEAEQRLLFLTTQRQDIIESVASTEEALQIRRNNSD